jgi:hypothetical protein
MGEIRPLVINREVVMPAISDKRKIIVNASEYDGMREWTDVRPLTVSNVIKDIKDWDREWDYCDPSNCEYSWGFFLEYRKRGQVSTSVRYGWDQGGMPGLVTPTSQQGFDNMNDVIDDAVHDLEQKPTEYEILNFTIDGKTARKMWYQINTQEIDFTQA